MYFATKLQDFLYEDARYLTSAYGCELVHDSDGNYLALSTHQDLIEAIEIEAKDFFNAKESK